MTDPATSGNFDPGAMPASSLSSTKSVWYRRPWFMVMVVVVVVVGVSVVTDLPHHISPGEDASAQNASIKQINLDLAPCNYAISEMYHYYETKIAASAAPLQSQKFPKWMTDDQSACSFTSGSIYDLTNNFQALDTNAGKHIDNMHTIVVTWITSDALGAINDIMYLFNHPGDATKIAALRKRTALLNAEHAQAMAEWSRANSLLGGRLFPLKLVQLPSVA
jgi:hypothetical protein